MVPMMSIRCQVTAIMCTGHVPSFVSRRVGVFSLAARHSAVVLGFAQGWLCENHCRQIPPEVRHCRWACLPSMLYAIASRH